MLISPMSRLRFLTIFLLALVFIPFSQSLHSPKDIYKLFSNQTSSPKPRNNTTRTLSDVDQHYLDACTAILKGFDDVKDDSYSYDHDFAEWENTNPDVTFLDYFKNNKGLVSKIFIDDGDYYYDLWAMYLIIYNGLAIDQKAAAVDISIQYFSDMNFNRTDATFTTKENSTFTVYYGEYYETLGQTYIDGQVSISFVDTTNNQPMSQFSPQKTSLKGYGFKISFVSSDGSFSFSTTSFSDTYMTTTDTIITWVFIVVSLILVAYSWYTKDMKGKVALGTLHAFYASAAFILFWTFIQPRYFGLLFFMLIIPALFNLIKCIPYLFASVTIESLVPSIGVIVSIYFGALNWISTIWINLFPSLILWLQFFQKLFKMKQDPYYLTSFEIGSYSYVLLWMGYAFLYPRNFYRFGQNLTMIYISFGSIIFQFVVLAIMEKITMKKLKKAALLEDDSMNNQGLNQDSNNQTKQSPGDDENPQSTPNEETLRAKKRRERKSVS